MIEIILGMLGGLALFLYGMNMMSSGLEAAAGDKLKPILEKVTKNKVVAILVGALVTALVQSSSATVVMMVSFVNSGIMTLEQTVYVIMGANIGTTLTTQLIALNITLVADLIAIIGVTMMIFLKRSNNMRNIGMILAGMGILFIGMDLMSGAVEPLKTMPAFTNIMAAFENPLVGILIGMLVTGIIQSSAGTLGILQALSVTGAVTLSNSIYLMLGADIGTCVTGLLASMGGTRDAKRTALIHLLFNVIGVFIFVILMQFIPYVSLVAATSTNVKVQIANANTIYKIVITLILFPFGKQLAQLSRLIIKDPKEEAEKSEEPQLVTSGITPKIGTAAVAVSEMRREVNYMMDLVHDNLRIGIDDIISYKPDKRDLLYENETKINECNKQIHQYVDAIAPLTMNKQDTDVCLSIFKMSTDLERMGDHAKNFIEYLDWKSPLNEEAVEELKTMRQMMEEMFFHFRHNDLATDLNAVGALENIEQSVDILTEQYRQAEIQRLSEKKCSSNVAVEYANILIEIERVFDHMINIMEECRNHKYSVFTMPEPITE